MNKSAISSIENNDTEESYQFHANVCPILAKMINVPEYKCKNEESWVPPNSSGLFHLTIYHPIIHRLILNIT